MGNCSPLCSKKEVPQGEVDASKYKSIGNKEFVPNFIIENSDSITQFYQIGEKIGEGAYGEVRKALHKPTKQIRAIKVIGGDEVEEHEPDKTFNEIRILRKLNHPNIVKIYEYFVNDNYFYIVMEFMAEGELYHRIVREKGLSEEQAKSYTQQILEGVNYLHQRVIVHGDLKPENILFSS